MKALKCEQCGGTGSRFVEREINFHAHGEKFLVKVVCTCQSHKRVLVGTLNCAPQWAEVVALLSMRAAEGDAMARTELDRMAALADKSVKLVEDTCR